MKIEIFYFFVLGFAPLFAQTNPFFANSVRHGNIFYTSISVNNIFMWEGNNGDGSHDPLTDGAGLMWKNENSDFIPATFQDGLIYGGKIDGQIRANGNTYRQGLQQGNIISVGVAANPQDSIFKVWRIYKNWQSLPDGEIKDEFQYNYDNWPGELGAPFIDVDLDGKFTKGIDKPDFIGDQVLFYVANDLDTAATNFFLGSNPIGLEFQVTTWAYENVDSLKDVVFKKYKMINKSGKEISDMYISYWADDDLGFANDDFSGCDTTLNLGYCWNGDNNDEDNFGTPPPALGHLLLQGPIVPSMNDQAFVSEKKIDNFKNLNMNAFTFFIGASSIYRDFEMGNYIGTVHYYNNAQGLRWDGKDFIDPTNYKKVKMLLYGDPEKNSGWYEGDGWPGAPVPDDRRMMLSTGSFNMQPDESQEIVFAVLLAKGTDNKNSVTELKKYAQKIQKFWNPDFVVNVKETATPVISDYKLFQNYPNPFNPTTTIQFVIPNEVRNLKDSRTTKQSQHVLLKVYDVLGREVATLVNEEKPAGNYEVTFDASELSSGIYFYKLQTGSFVQTKKMILLR